MKTFILNTSIVFDPDPGELSQVIKSEKAFENFSIKRPASKKQGAKSKKERRISSNGGSSAFRL